jgi:serine/threonine protein phosphatase PrpC
MYSPGHGIRLRSSAQTNKGRVRPNNEDSVHLWGEGSYVLAVVADGMGGAAAGEEASRIAVETVQQRMTNGTYKKPGDYGDMDSYTLAEKLENLVREANNNILSRAKAKPEYQGMGTTMTVIFARHTDVIVAHVGDSRAYMVDGHDGSISQITTDHSFVQALIDAGYIKREEAEGHPMSNVLYRALGQSPDVDIDLIEDVQMHVGDRLIMCSDGLTLHVKPHEIAQLAMSDPDPSIISSKLIDLANSRGGRDNISVISIVAEGDPSAFRDDSMTMDVSSDDTTMSMKSVNPPPTPKSSSRTPTNMFTGPDVHSSVSRMLTSSTALQGEGHDRHGWGGR